MAAVSRIVDWNEEKANTIRVKKAVVHNQYRVHPVRMLDNSMIYIESCPATLAFISPYTDGNNNKSIRICNTRHVGHLDVIGRSVVSRIKDANIDRYRSCADEHGNVTCTMNVKRCKVYDANASLFQVDEMMLHVRVRVILRVDGVVISDDRCYVSLYVEQMILDEFVHLPSPPKDRVEKYARMLSVGVPLEAVHQKMTMDKCPHDLIQSFDARARELQTVAARAPPPPPSAPPPRLASICGPSHRVPTLGEILEARSRLKPRASTNSGGA